MSSLAARLNLLEAWRKVAGIWPLGKMSSGQNALNLVCWNLAFGESLPDKVHLKLVSGMKPTLGETVFQIKYVKTGLMVFSYKVISCDF